MAKKLKPDLFTFVAEVAVKLATLFQSRATAAG